MYASVIIDIYFGSSVPNRSKALTRSIMLLRSFPLSLAGGRGHVAPRAGLRTNGAAWALFGLPFHTSDCALRLGAPRL